MEGEVEENAAGLAAPQAERREDAPVAVDEEAMLLLLKLGSRVPCRIVDLSLTGCRMCTRERFLAGLLVRVEATFKVRGIAFRFNGVTESIDGQNVVGIRFTDLTSRRRDELAEVLCEVAAENAARHEKQPAGVPAADEVAAIGRTLEKVSQQPAGQKTQPRLGAPASGAQQRPAPPALAVRSLAKAPELAQGGTSGRSAPLEPASSGQTANRSAGKAKTPEPQPGELQPAGQAGAKPPGRERRTQSRHEVDTSAVIFLVNVASRLHGRILNLSLGGCRIRTDERFPVGIYTRVETEFHIEGLPFRLGGVVQAIQDRNHVGIRFLDMSERKREQVEHLIEEIDELHEREELAGAEASGKQVLPA